MLSIRTFINEPATQLYITLTKPTLFTLDHSSSSELFTQEVHCNVMKKPECLEKANGPTVYWRIYLMLRLGSESSTYIHAFDNFYSLGT
jgi:glycerol-3-phosphate O-acyltransferase